MSTNSGALIIPAAPPATTTNVALDGDIRDIRSPVAIPSGWTWLWWTLAAVAVAAGAWLAIRRWKKQPRPKPPEITVPPHERARRKLQEALEFLDEPPRFCVLVSDAVRLYLEEAFAMRAPERTTEEFLEELQSSALLSFSHKQSLGDFLMRCDLVKFARHEPSVEHLQELYQSALRLVDETAFTQPLAGSTPSPGEASSTPRPPAKSPLPKDAGKDS